MTSRKRDARITGLAYLGLAVSALSGFLFIRGQLYVPDDATRTAANLIAHEGLPRLGVVTDIAVVLTQAVTPPVSPTRSPCPRQSVSSGWSDTCSPRVWRTGPPQTTSRRTAPSWH